jgi:cobalt-zinc-cadmium efflux system outer membrane protein
MLLPIALLRAQTPAPTTTTLTADAAPYVDPARGVSSLDLVRRAIGANGELAAAHLGIERARARVTQATLFPNPELDLERTTGSWTGSNGNSETAIGLAFAFELGGKRSTRIAIAQAELAAVQAELSERQRRVVGDVLAAYIEALAALRELDATARLNELDIETGKYVETRVSEGDASPLEMKLLRVEIERLRARRILLRGQLEASMLRLRNLVGIPLNETLQFRHGFAAAAPTAGIPAKVDEAVEVALRSRPDLQLARLNEQTAQATLRGARALAVPDVTGFTRYAEGSSLLDDTPVGPIADSDKLISFGVSVTLPFFHRNQGARAEAQAMIEQSRREREFVESVVRADVESAYRRYEAVRDALAAYESGVISASLENISTIEAAYRLGEFRITDLIAERRRFVDSQREYTDLLAERERSLADLQLAMGNLSPEEK